MMHRRNPSPPPMVEGGEGGRGRFGGGRAREGAQGGRGG